MSIPRVEGNVTLMTVARAVGVSPMTVSNAYNRPHKLSPALRERFDWRSDSVVVASKKVHCITYDKLYDDLSTRLKIFTG